MTNKVDPYVPPKPLEPSSEARERRLASRIPTVLWWCFFIGSCAFLVYCAVSLTALALRYQWSWWVSPLGFRVLLQAIGLVGLFGYLRNIPLFNSFFWGLVFLSRLGFSLYISVKLGYLVLTSVEPVPVSVIALTFAPFLLPAPEYYALWRYSSSSSPVWKAPRIRWKTLGRRIGDAIQDLRRA